MARRNLVAVPVLVGAGLLAACGGGGEAVEDEPSLPQEAGTEPVDDPRGGAGGGEQPMLSTDPGTAYAAVDGRRFEYVSSGSLAYMCDIATDVITVNFQTAEGQDLLVQARRSDGRWQGQLAFASAGDSDARYAVALGQDSGALAVGDESLSYQGSVSRRQSPAEPGTTDVEVEVAVNCAPASGGGGTGGDPTAEVGGVTYSFPLSGAQSVTCEVAPDDVEIRINRLAAEDLQLEIDMTGGPGDWLGSVSVYTSDGTYRATLSGAAEGFSVDGDTVSYEGPLELGATASAATVSVTCP